MDEYSDEELSKMHESHELRHSYLDKWFNSALGTCVGAGTKIPILHLNAKRTGYTDYIDYICWDEVIHPVMRGWDKYKRPFIVIKVLIDKKYKLMQTFFQRYTDDKYPWVGAGCIGNEFLDTCGGMNVDQFIFIKKLIEQYLKKDYNKNIIIKNEHKTREHYIGNIVKIVDFNELKAYNTICRAWLNCSFNPEYKICQKKQQKIYENLQKNY